MESRELDTMEPVEETYDSETYTELIEAVEEELSGLSHKGEQVYELREDGSVAGVRVDVTYTAELDDSPVRFDVHVFYPEDGFEQADAYLTKDGVREPDEEMDMTGYVRQGSLLLQEWYMDDEEGPVFDEYDGAIFLESRD